MKPQDFIKELKRMHNSQKRTDTGCGTCKAKDSPCLSYIYCNEKAFAKLYNEVENWADNNSGCEDTSELLNIIRCEDCISCSEEFSWTPFYWCSNKKEYVTLGSTCPEAKYRDYPMKSYI